MAVIVKKFGGTSVATIERIQHAAKKVVKARQEGHDVVVVVSAMGDETDRLYSLAHAISNNPSSRETAALVSTGEQVSISLFCMALQSLGFEAKSYTGWQARIVTTASYDKARILDIDCAPIVDDLALGKIVVIAGFQGIDKFGNITTLGRGGSDTTAVAVASAIQAEQCHIYTDVDGVYTSDPRIVPKARLLKQVTFEEMLELASLGWNVLQIRSVGFAYKYGVPLIVRSTFNEGPGTLVTSEVNTMEHAIISGIAFNKDLARLTMSDIPNLPGIAAKILQPLSDANIEVDMIVQNSFDDPKTNLSFTVSQTDYQKAKELLDSVAKELQASQIFSYQGLAKLSVVGVGMRSNPGVASTMFKTLGDLGINIQMITSSEIKVSVLIEESELEKGARALHTVFGLDADPV